MTSIAKFTAIVSMLFALGGCSMHKETAPGVSSADRDVLRERYLDWERSRGQSPWERMRAQDVERIHAVGLTPDL